MSFLKVFEKHSNKKKKNSKGGPFDRSTDYRKDYINNHKGFFGIYSCAYCGKILSRSEMQVDHIYPVHGVNTMDMRGTTGKLFVSVVSLFHGPKALSQGVNAGWNKTAACPKCNSSKSDKGGLWVVRGYFGKILFPIINFIIFFGLLYGTFKAIFGNTEILYRIIFFTVVLKILAKVFLCGKPKR